MTEAGTIFVLSKTGAVLRQHSYPRGSVRAIKLAGIGLVTQVGDVLFDGTFRLPPRAQMLDYAQGRVLYRIDRAVYTHRVGTGVRAQLLGFPTTTAPVAFDVHGLAWAVGRSVHWKCAACVRYRN